MKKKIGLILPSIIIFAGVTVTNYTLNNTRCAKTFLIAFPL